MRPINIHLDSKLTAQTRKLEQMNLILKSNLPPECDGHYNVAGIRGDTVIIITDSPVWTTRLRQLSGLILQTLTRSAPAHSDLAQSSQQPLHHVRVVSRYGPIPDHHQPTPVKRTISQQSCQQIAQAASYISDKKLKNALLKISRHGKS